MEIFKSKPQLALTQEEKDYISGIVQLTKKFDFICDEIDDCEDCPIYDVCHQVIYGRPDSLADFFQSLLDNSI